MDFFDRLGKKATEAYKVTADKTGKIAKETKLRFKMSELKSKIEDLYEEMGKIVYEKHIQKKEISIEKDLAEQCKKVDEMSKEIEDLLQQCLELKDKKQCPNCYKEIDKNMKFCPECGSKQEEKEEAKKVEVIDDKQEDLKGVVIIEGDEKQEEKEETTEAQSNLEKTTEVEINPDAENISEEEMKNIGI